MPNGRSPRQISVSLLFVETRLGTFLGKEKAFYTLASMASSRRPEAISTYVAQLPGSTAADRQSWIQQRMEQRSDWAYKLIHKWRFIYRRQPYDVNSKLF